MKGRPPGTISAGPRRQFRRDSETNKNTDHLAYRYWDSGCSQATKLLGYQSICTKNCPYDECRIKSVDDKRNGKAVYNELEPLYS